MNSLLVFNHHSLPMSTPVEAEPLVFSFIKTCLGAQRIGLKTILVDKAIDKDWFRLELAERYFWKDWHDQHVKNSKRKDEIRAFRSILTKQPLFSDEELAMEDVGMFEVCLRGAKEPLAALAAAEWNKSPLLSFPTRPPWKDSPLAIVVERLSSDGEIESQDGELCNLHSYDQFEREKSKLQAMIQEQASSGQQLLENFDKFYPFIRLCGNAEDQLRRGFPKNFIKQIKDALTVLNDFSVRLNDGIIEGYSHEELRNLGLQHEVSGESESVKQDPNLRKEREFYLPNGRKMMFENHVKFSRGTRMHFFVDQEKRQVYVGYIGSHLKL